MIGIICPSQFELEHLEVNQPECETDIICSGMGKVRSLFACHELLRRNDKVNYILLIGFAGGLTPTLAIGDVIEPQIFIEQDYNAEPLEPFPNKVTKTIGSKLIEDSKDAVMLTQDKFLTANPYGELASKEGYERLACDMESYAVAYFCEESKVPFSVIKLISDNADDTADHDFLGNCKKLSPMMNRKVNQAIQSISENLIIK